MSQRPRDLLEDLPVSQPGMWLEIRRGKTNFPLRPISGDRFLIGAGSHCHLQLGGEHVPMLHSLLVIEGHRAHLEAVVSEPPLLVNGKDRRSVDLIDEDTVTIGDFEFVFHRLVKSEPATQAAAKVDSVPEQEVSGVDDLVQLSAGELVDLIEQESRQISEYNRNRELGATALLQAVRIACEPSHPVSVPMTPMRQETTLETLAEQLRAQSQRLAERESECLQRLAQLQEAQQQLATQMAEFAKQVSQWQIAEQGPPIRVSA